MACSQASSTLSLNSEEIHDIMLKELIEGAEDGIKCGIIGEIGVSWPMHRMYDMNLFYFREITFI